MAREQPPNVVVIHVGTGRSAVDDQLRELMYLVPARRTILLCHGVSPDEIAAAVGLGAGAVISEDCGAEGLLDAFEAVRQGRPYLGPGVSDILRGKTAAVSDQTRAATAGHLTARERQVLGLIAQARTGQEIATLLGMSLRTVHAHRRSIMRKLQVRNTVALVRRAMQLGLVTQ
jgi:DNA-binding NarL/FixJ family response regulator